MNELSGNASARAARLINRPGIVPGLCGAALLAQLFVLRAIASANLDSVTFAGHTLDDVCWFRQRFGVPCPFCGMTRSVLLTQVGLSIVPFVGWILVLLDLLFPLWDEKKQTIHDKAASTYVIKRA